MNRIKNFFGTVRSVATFNLYKDRATTPNAFTFWPAFRYLTACVFIFSVIFAFTGIPLAGFLVKITREAPSYFPENLVLTISKGKAVSNINPFIIPMNSQTNPKYSSTPKNFATINTDKKFTLEDFYASDSALYVASDYFATLKNNSVRDVAAGQKTAAGVQIQPYSSFGDLTLSRPSIQAFTAKIIENKFVFFIILPIAFCLASFIGITVGALFMGLVSALITLVYAKFRSMKVTFSTLYILTLYVATFTLAVRIVFLAAGMNPFSLFYTLLSAIMIVVMLERAQNQNQNQTPAETTPSTPNTTA